MTTGRNLEHPAFARAAMNSPYLPSPVCPAPASGSTAAPGQPRPSAGEKTRKPSNSVKLSQIEDPSEGHNSLEPCGKTGLYPTLRPMPGKAPFWAKKPMK